jgi:uncharacterized protein (DUF608 family)
MTVVMTCVCVYVDRARGAYVYHLWNGRYFNYDASGSSHHNRLAVGLHLENLIGVHGLRQVMNKSPTLR